MEKQQLKQLICEVLEKYTKGLHQSKIGDKVYIGIEGTRGKWFDEISKIFDDGKVKVKGGDIFNPDGRIFRGKSITFQKQHNKNKTISAKIITQKEFDQSFKNIKVDFLRRFDYNKLKIEDILTIIDSIPNYDQANTKHISRFK
jgi:hypothetical protein|tara:strand:- start:1313 stop:1744 length:432 start_codon:yes stop_codon:yes gene_type:complete